MVTTITSHNACNQAGCPLRESGLCLESLEPNECPHSFFINIEEDQKEPTEPEALVQPRHEQGLMLFSGEEMHPTQVDTITFANPTNLILIMGAPNSGKTTLLAAIFDAFQKGPFGNFLFAGSRTQIGFEKRCHLARLASGKIYPDTERTPSKEFSYLHLAVRDAKLLRPIQNLLFTDVSGERFQQARDFDEQILNLTVLRQADHIFYVINGDHLSDSGLRHTAKADAIKLIGRAQQNNMIPLETGICLLISKWDVVVQRELEEKVKTFFVEAMLKQFPNLIKRVEFVAARPKSGNTLPLYFGLDSFLNSCISKEKQIEENHPNTIKYSADIREFYKERALTKIDGR